MTDSFSCYGTENLHHLAYCIHDMLYCKFHVHEKLNYTSCLQGTPYTYMYFKLDHFYLFHEQLHRCNYDHGKALQALVKSPALRSIEKKWTEDELVSIV